MWNAIQSAAGRLFGTSKDEEAKGEKQAEGEAMEGLEKDVAAKKAKLTEGEAMEEGLEKDEEVKKESQIGGGAMEGLEKDEEVKEENQIEGEAIEGLEKDEEVKEENQTEGEAMEGLEKDEEVMETEEVPEILDFDSLVQNPGLQHIAELVFSFLEAKDLTKCRLVSRKWRDTIDPLRYWWILHLKPIKTIKMRYKYSNEDGEDQIEEVLFLEKFPKWNEVFDYFETQANLENLKRFVDAMQIYHKSGIAPRNTFGCPLLFAIGAGALDFVQLYMQSPLNFNDPISRSYNALHYACFHGRVSVVQLLFDKEGLDLNARTGSNRTAFHIACEQGYPEIVEMFLNNYFEKEIDLNARSERGHTALHHACMGRYDNPDGPREKRIVQVLFDHPVAQNFMNVNAVDNQGVTPFHMAVNTELLEVVELFLVMI